MVLKSVDAENILEKQGLLIMSNFERFAAFSVVIAVVAAILPTCSNIRRFDHARAFVTNILESSAMPYCPDGFGDVECLVIINDELTKITCSPSGCHL